MPDYRIPRFIQRDYKRALKRPAFVTMHRGWLIDIYSGKDPLGILYVASITDVTGGDRGTMTTPVTSGWRETEALARRMVDEIEGPDVDPAA